MATKRKPTPASGVIGAEPVEVTAGIVARVAQAYEEVAVEGGVKRAEIGDVIVETADGFDVMPVGAFTEAYPGVAL